MKRLFLFASLVLLAFTVGCAPQESDNTQPEPLYNLVEVEFDLELADFPVILNYAGQHGYTVAHIRRNPLVGGVTATFKVPVA